jgi:hypothetical protein
MRWSGLPALLFAASFDLRRHLTLFSQRDFQSPETLKKYAHFLVSTYSSAQTEPGCVPAIETPQTTHLTFTLKPLHTTSGQHCASCALRTAFFEQYFL